MIGAACAYYCTAVGLSVTVIERSFVGSGTTAACEGNILLSDKQPGAELNLAIQSSRLWSTLADDLGAESLEYQAKGGIVVATTEAVGSALVDFTEAQRQSGIAAVDVSPDELLDLEPNLNPAVVAGAYYHEDRQVQPTLAAARLLQHVRSVGGTVLTGTSVVGFVRDSTGRLTGVHTDSSQTPTLTSDWVVNAAGTWAGQIADLAGVKVPILPRRGFILVTEVLPRVIRHKVYTAEYIANVASSGAGLETSTVVEGTAGGTVLIGASRERVGFDRTFSLPVVSKLAAQAIEVFPFLAEVSLLRTYLGFRPYSPDHLPIIGIDPRVPGLIQASGHEGSGIGLAPATGALVAQLITGEPPLVDVAPFRPDRFQESPP